MESKYEYPVYIVSKGRYEITLTADNFEKCGINYLIVVEPQEFEFYCKKLSSKRVLKLPFSNLGLGSFPARNFCWEHSKAMGYKYHWVFDDNIINFDKWVDGKRTKWDNILDALLFVQSFSIKNNIDISGFEETNFCVKPPIKAFKINCHVYSAMFIKNTLPYRWRLKYNEDVDLCLQVLDKGGKTASCVYYLADKKSTSDKMKGGNQDELYKGNDPKKKLLKAKMLEKVWPQYSKTVIRFNRYHHLIDWKVFNKKNDNRIQHT